MDTIPLQKDCQNLYKTNPATNSRRWRPSMFLDLCI